MKKNAPAPMATSANMPIAIPAAAPPETPPPPPPPPLEESEESVCVGVAMIVVSRC
jgi:hypothetical protein